MTQVSAKTVIVLELDLTQRLFNVLRCIAKHNFMIIELLMSIIWWLRCIEKHNFIVIEVLMNTIWWLRCIDKHYLMIKMHQGTLFDDRCIEEHYLMIKMHWRTVFLDYRVIDVHYLMIMKVLMVCVRSLLMEFLILIRVFQEYFMIILLWFFSCHIFSWIFSFLLSVVVITCYSL